MTKDLCAVGTKIKPKQNKTTIYCIISLFKLNNISMHGDKNDLNDMCNVCKMQAHTPIFNARDVTIDKTIYDTHVWINIEQ